MPFPITNDLYHPHTVLGIISDAQGRPQEEMRKYTWHTSSNTYIIRYIYTYINVHIVNIYTSVIFTYTRVCVYIYIYQGTYWPIYFTCLHIHLMCLCECVCYSLVVSILDC